MQVLADFGDFQVVETKNGIDLIDITKAYHMIDEVEFKEIPKKTKKKRREMTDDQTAYMVIAYMFIVILSGIIWWIYFGY